MALSQSDLLKVFVEEATEHLSFIENDLLALEKAGDVTDRTLVNKVFRTAHSIKGGAGFIGLTNIKDLSHKMETVLGRIRNGSLAPNPEIINILLLASDALKNLVMNVETSDTVDISPAMEVLNSIDVPRKAPDSGPDGSMPEDADSMAPATAPPDWAGVFPEMKISENDLLQARQEKKHIYLLRIDFINDKKFQGKPAQGIIDEIKDYGMVLSVRTGQEPGVLSEATDLETHPFLYIAIACVLDPGDAELLLDVGRENLFPVADGLDGPAPEPSSWIHPEPLPDIVPKGAIPAEQKFSQPETCNISLSDVPPASIRVNVHLLDLLMNLAGELVLGRNQLLKAISGKDRNHTELAGKRIDLITSDLQKVIMLTRMQPVGSLFNKYPRLVRNLSRELRKETVLEIAGADVELDRTLLEAISDPLNHLIRNAVDHGIETAGVRKMNGKGESGKIVLRAFNEGGQVVIEVSDDGAGIDPEKVAAAAVSKGFASEEQVRVMADKDKLNLIFLPGFSTARTVSDLSGRGVGMDVVKTNLDNLGGLIDLFSTPGQGTRIKIKLPLTLAIITCQIVSVENDRFAIPQMNMEEMLRIPAAMVKERIEQVGDAEVVRLRGKLLPLVRLAEILGMERTYLDPKTGLRKRDRRAAIADRRSRKSTMHANNCDADALHVTRPSADAGRSTAIRKDADRRYHTTSALNIAVVSTGQFKYGLIVDAFCDSEEIVVKPLGRHFKTCRGYAGATIMGDGKVALILDVGNLSEMAGLFSVSGTQRAVEVAMEAEKATLPESDKLHLLVFGCAEDEQFALPLHQVLRIERIGFADVQSFGGIRSIQYRGANLPVFSIDQIARVRPLAACEHLLVIVFVVAARELGLLATGPVDSVVAEVAVNGSALKQPGIMGSMILNGKTTLLVDVLDLVRNLQPDWFAAANSQKIETMKGQTILFVEDSNFFRSQIKSFIQQEGYRVVEAEDGEAAWKMLQSFGQDISLVVTDMEMPRINGFELTEMIRKDERFSRIPIIALTTLADDKDMERAKLAGVNEYQIKLDKEMLLDSIGKLIRQAGGNHV